LNTTYLLLGSNIGDSHLQLEIVSSLISDQIGIISASSHIYETDPWGKTDQNSFLNQALEVKTRLNPIELLSKVLSIEVEMGRTRSVKWEPRIIDIDIIFFNQEVIKEEGLSIPHPFMHKRNFVLAPLLEIIPNYIHPQLNNSIRQLYSQSADSSQVKILVADGS